jgi:hypothetical protein
MLLKPQSSTLDQHIHSTINALKNPPLSESTWRTKEEQQNQA